MSVSSKTFELEIVIYSKHVIVYGSEFREHCLCTGIHKFKARLPPRDPKSIRAQPYDPIPPVAEQISSQWWLLCFDEFQVTSLSVSYSFRDI